jgi:hypothetical protein
MSEAACTKMGVGTANGLFAATVTHRPGRDSASARAELMRWIEGQAILASARGSTLLAPEGVGDEACQAYRRQEGARRCSAQDRRHPAMSAG